MTPNPNENQAEKHSAEPFQVTLIENPAPIFYIQDGNGVDVCKFNPFNKDKANANRFVACLTFCAGLTNERMAAFKPLKDVIDINRDQNLELQSLRAELSTLRKELEAAKKAQEWVDKCGSDILSLAGDYIEWFALDETSKYSIARNELRELLNNGKDGK